jgi:hypothetical protein
MTSRSGFCKPRRRRSLQDLRFTRGAGYRHSKNHDIWFSSWSFIRKFWVVTGRDVSQKPRSFKRRLSQQAGDDQRGTPCASNSPTKYPASVARLVIQFNRFEHAESQPSTVDVTAKFADTCIVRKRRPTCSTSTSSLFDITLQLSRVAEENLLAASSSLAFIGATQRSKQLSAKHLLAPRSQHLQVTFLLCRQHDVHSRR